MLENRQEAVSGEYIGWSKNVQHFYPAIKDIHDPAFYSREAIFVDCCFQLFNQELYLLEE